MKILLFSLLLIAFVFSAPVDEHSKEKDVIHLRERRRISSSDEVTETPDTDVDRRKREAEHGCDENQVPGGEVAAHIDVRDKRRIKQPTGPATTTTEAPHHEEIEHHEALEHNEEKRSVEEPVADDHTSADSEDSGKSHSNGDSEDEEPLSEGHNIGDHLGEHTEPEDGFTGEVVVRAKKATHGSKHPARLMQKNKSNSNVGETSGMPGDQAFVA
ncbi:unnamed protein product, partial [Mesorhabditis spiculigera]